MKKKDIIGLQRQNKTKINPHCGVKTDYWTHEVRHIKSFAPTNVFLYNGLRASTYWLLSPTWIDFRKSKALKFNYRFLLNVFCFFRLRHAVFTSVKPSSHGGILFMQGDGFAVPLHPLKHAQLKTWKTEPNKWVNTPQGRKGALAPCIK